MARVLPLMCLAALLGAQDSNGSYGKLYPTDDGAKDASFVQFRRQLLAAVARRDVRFIESILAPEILNSFGGDGGPKEFRETWKLERPGSSSLWLTMRTILNMGKRPPQPRDLRPVRLPSLPRPSGPGRIQLHRSNQTPCPWLRST